MQPQLVYCQHILLPPDRRTAAGSNPGRRPRAAAPFGPRPAEDPDRETLQASELQRHKYHPALRFIQPEPPQPEPPGATDWTLNNLAVSSLAADPFQASRRFREALLHDDQSAVLWTNLGLTSLAVGDLDRAVENFQQATGREPAFAPAWNYLALTYFEAGRFRQSWDCFQQALRCDDQEPLVHSNCSVLFLALNQPQPARKHCKAALAADPECYPAYYNLSSAWRQLGDRQAAAECRHQGNRSADRIWQFSLAPTAA